MSDEQPPTEVPQDREPGSSELSARTHHRSFVRRHPALTVAGAVGVGLVGGLELAGGMLIGAVIATILQRDDARRAALRTRVRHAADHVPQVVRDRARAVVDAALGRSAPQKPDETAPAPST